VPLGIDAGPLRERAFRLLFLGQSFSVLGNQLAPIALAFAVLEADGSATDLGLVLAAQSVPTVLFLLVGGVFADRLPRRAVMIASDLVRAGTQAALAVLLLAGQAELWHFFVLQATNGFATAFFYPASGGLVPETVSPGRLQQANALLSLSRSGGMLAGPAIAGLIVATVGPAWGLVADAATFAISAWFLALMPLAPHSRAAVEPFLRELREGWQEFRSRTWLWLGVLYSAFGNMLTLSPFLVLGPVISERSLGGATAWALIAGGFAVGAILGDLVALRFRPDRPILWFGLLLLPLAIAPAALAIELPAVAIAALCTIPSAGLSLANTVWITTVMQKIPPAALSRVTAYDWFGSLAFQPLGFALAGPAAALLGTEATLWISAAWGVGSTAVLVAIPDVRHLRSRPDVEESPRPLSSLLEE
jgi:predicted MFS family arabinose efflux permease